MEMWCERIDETRKIFKSLQKCKNFNVSCCLLGYVVPNNQMVPKYSELSSLPLKRISLGSWTLFVQSAVLDSLLFS